MLNSNMSQQILKEVDGSFKSFFGLLKLAKKGKYFFNAIKLPKYLPKDGFTTLIIGFVRLRRSGHAYKNKGFLIPNFLNEMIKPFPEAPTSISGGSSQRKY